MNVLGNEDFLFYKKLSNLLIKKKTHGKKYYIFYLINVRLKKKKNPLYFQYYIDQKKNSRKKILYFLPYKCEIKKKKILCTFNITLTKKKIKIKWDDIYFKL